MNYYRRFMGDYQRDTAHLSVIEHGAYTLLLDHYYATRRALPSDLDALCRLCRAMAQIERDAVKTVSEEFFRIADDGMRHNARADKEIASWVEYAAEQSRKGKLGGRPPKANGKPEESPGLSAVSPGPKPEESPPPPPPPPPPDSGVSFGDSRPEERTVRLKPAYEGEEFHEAVIADYHDILPDLPRVKVRTKKRRQALNARIRERLKDGKAADTVEYWQAFFRSVAASDFLCGRRTDFRADLEWLLRPENFAKVIEGRYAPGNGRADHAR